MRLASWHWGGRLHAGLMSACGRELTPLEVPQPERGVLRLVQALVRGDGLPREAGPRLPVDAVTLAAPLPRPLRSLLCVGRNYQAHAAELAGSIFQASAPRTGAGADTWPMVFTKFGECVVGPHDDVRLPGRQVSEQIDYESELAVVIGRGGRDIPRSRAMDHVFGCTVVNDVTARDVQQRHGQWTLGKNFDSFCPMGPCITTADALDGRDTRVRGWVTPAGGTPELRQDGHTRDMLFDIPSLIEHCSRGITLLPGDVIATGTPAGVGMGFSPPRWLQSGDVVRIEIDGIGAIANRFI